MSRVRAFERRQRQRGYTMVELMMALAIFMVAVLGIFTMQRAALASNNHAKSMAMAQQLAHGWAAQLEMDATQWRTTLTTDWLGNDPQWRRPAYLANRQIGSAFDALGNPLTDSAADKLKARFCTNIRMSWLFPTTMNRAGNGVLRAEIRVYYLRDGATPFQKSQFCNEDDGQTAVLGQHPEIYQFSYEAVAVRQHSTI